MPWQKENNFVFFSQFKKILKNENESSYGWGNKTIDWRMLEESKIRWSVSSQKWSEAASCEQHEKLRRVQVSKNHSTNSSLTDSVQFICYREIVDAAHLKPLSRDDKMNPQTVKSRWNASVWMINLLYRIWKSMNSSHKLT